MILNGKLQGWTYWKKPELKGVESIKLELSKTVTREMIKNNGGGIEVKVKTARNESLPDPINFEVVFPEKLIAMHKDGGTPAPGFPFDGSALHGASARLIVTVCPLDVSFDELYISEEDKGIKPGSGTLATPHKAGSNWLILANNEFDVPDEIGSNPSTKELLEYKDQDGMVKKHQYPQSFTWYCSFSVYDFVKKNIDEVCRIDQIFHYEKNNDEDYTISISKFPSNESDSAPACSVSRRTGGNHNYQP